MLLSLVAGCAKEPPCEPLKRILLFAQEFVFTSKIVNIGDRGGQRAAFRGAFRCRQRSDIVVAAGGFDLLVPVPSGKYVPGAFQRHPGDLPGFTGVGFRAAPGF